MRFTANIDFTKTTSQDITGTGLKTTYYGKLPVCYWGTNDGGKTFSFYLLPLTIPEGFQHISSIKNPNGTLSFSSPSAKVPKHFQMMIMMDIKRRADIESLGTKILQTLAINKSYKNISIEPIHEQSENKRTARIINNGGIPPIKPVGPFPTPLGTKGCIGGLFDNGSFHYFVYNEGTRDQYYMIPVVFPSMFVGYYRYKGDFIHKVIEMMANFETGAINDDRTFPFEIAPDTLVLSEPMAGIVYIDDLTYPSKSLLRNETIQISFNSLNDAIPPAPDLDYV